MDNVMTVEELLTLEPTDAKVYLDSLSDDDFDLIMDEIIELKMAHIVETGNSSINETLEKLFAELEKYV